MFDTGSGGNAVENDYVDNTQVTTETVEVPVDTGGEQVEGEQTQANQDTTTEKRPEKGGFVRKLEAKDAEIARLKAELEVKSTPLKVDAEPKEEDFDNLADYYKAVAKWEVKQELGNHQTETRKGEIEKRYNDLSQQYTQKTEAFRKVTPDFDAVVDSFDEPLTPALQQALLESDFGPEIAYYIAKNPEETAKLFTMGIVQLNKEIGRIEARLEQGKSSPEPVVVKTTKAPPPINPISKGTATSTKDPGDMSYDEFREWEKGRK